MYCCLVLSSFTVAHNCHGKTKNLKAKTKYLTAKPKTSQQNRKPHGKTKDLTAKPNTSQQKQIPMAKPKLFCFCCDYHLVLPWGFWLCREVFCFCREVIGFAVRFSVLQWQLWATRLLCSWENLTKWTLLAQEPLPCRFSDRLDVYFWGGKTTRLYSIGRIPFAEMPDTAGVSKNLEKKTIISSLPNDESGRPVLTLYSLRGRRSKGKGRLDFLLIRLHRFKNRRFFVVILLGFSSL